MSKRLFPAVILLLLAASAHAVPVPPATNKDGSLVSGVLEAAFDPSSPTSPILPFPTNLLYPTPPSAIDLTLNLRPADPTDVSDPRVAHSALDGFSTTEAWTTTFLGSTIGPSTRPVGQIDPASVVAGQSVRVFEVTTLGYPFLVVTGVVRELVPEAEFTALVSSPGTLAIVPIVPLKEYTTYLAVLTNDINDVNGNDATPSAIYNLTKKRTPLIDANGKSVYPVLLPDANAQALEPLRQITQTMEGAAAAAGVNPNDIVLSWTVHTQSVTKTLKLLRSITQPAPVVAAPTGLSTAAVGGFGLADIVIGAITLPYYLGIPSAENPAAILTDNWQAEPGAYVPPFDQFGLDPTSTNITVANPFPALTGMQTVPILLAVPNANSGFTKPAAGWPVIIYSHGIVRNRTDMLALADTAARIGYAIIAMDHPLHGVVPEVEPHLAPFYIENTPLGAIAHERTFEADFFNNTTGAFQPDDIPDASGSSYFNLLNLLAARDNVRQSQADLSVLAASLQNISVDGDQSPDLNAMNVGFAGHSYGAFIGVPFLAVEPIVSRAYLNAGGSLLLRTAEAGSYGTRIRALLASVGLLPGTPQFNQFMLIGQSVIGAADPASWAAEARSKMPIIHNQVEGDDVVPNLVAGAPMGGNQGLDRLLGLQAYSSTQANPEGLKGFAHYVVGLHSSLLLPTIPEVTAEMQGQFASFIASGGTFVQVGNPDLLAPAAAPTVQGKDRENAKFPPNSKGTAKSTTPKGALKGEPK